MLKYECTTEQTRDSRALITAGKKDHLEAIPNREVEGLRETQ